MRETGFEIHRFLRSGHLEKVYESALVHRLRKVGVKVEQQVALHVYDEDGTLLGNFAADLFVEGKIIVELKACRSLVNEHVAQLLGYLRASRIEHGLLCNFGGPHFQIRKFILTETQDEIPTL